MNVKLVGRVMDVNESNGVAYVTFIDAEAGGMVKLALPGVTAKDLKPDTKLNLDVVVKPGIGKFGQFLKVISVNSNSQGKEV